MLSVISDFRSCLVSGGTILGSLLYSIRLSGKRCDLGTQRFPISGNFPPSVVTPAPLSLTSVFRLERNQFRPTYLSLMAFITCALAWDRRHELACRVLSTSPLSGQ